ncbi:hypothetical protein [Facklamia sp. P12955]|uniref:hypothetical protein n=1 Tax=Facklamia sp. P12955 TaxID=3421946 RepID=UPI003D16638C
MTKKRKFIVRRKFNKNRTATEAFLSLMIENNKTTSKKKVHIAKEKEIEYNRDNSIQSCLLEPSKEED